LRVDGRQLTVDSSGRRLGIVVMLALGFGSCRQDMHDQPKYEPYERSEIFDDSRASRLPVAGTVARGQLDDDDHLVAGKIGDQFADTFPYAITLDIVQRGQQRYEIYCTPCHGRSGRGNGMIVQRGYRPPPSFHIDRLRQERPGYFYDVIARGFGAMPDYAAQIAVRDRWAIVAYIRALQLSQNATLSDVPPALREELLSAAQR
jgi:mono/diheme cytochrome c family protein